MAEETIDTSVSTEFKETNEVIRLLELIAEARRKALADGVIDWRDAPYAATLLPAFYTATAGSQNIAKEFIQGNGEGLEATVSRLLAAVLDLVAPAKPILSA